MRVLIVGKGKSSSEIMTELIKADNTVGYVPNETIAARYLRYDPFDLILLVDHEDPEEANRIAERLKGVTAEEGDPAAPYVFLVCKDAEEFTKVNTNESGLKAIDAGLGSFSVEQCEHVYKCLRGGISIL